MATISSLGAGSNILTQDVLDQLRKADEASRVTPVDLKIADMKDRTSAMGKIEGWMDKLRSAVDSLSSRTLYTERSVSVSGTAVSVTAAANSDIQSFSLKVLKLATKEVNESGSFSSKTDPIASGVGTMTLNVGGTDFTLNYDDTTSLDSLKNQINNVAGNKVNASVVQLATGDYRLFLSAVETGDAQTITMTDNTGGMLGTQLSTGMTTIQEGVNASFEFNGQPVTRSSNTITDLVSGLTITLQTEGETSNVSVNQNRDAIFEKLDDFVNQYNTAMTEIGKMTHSSQDSKEAGIFSADSTIKGMKRDIEDMLSTLGGSHPISDYGFEVDKDGKLSYDKTVFNAKMDKNPANVEAAFAGGTYTNADGTTTELTGIFVEYKSAIDVYTKASGLLNEYSTTLGDRLTSLEEQRTKAIDRLDSKYELMAKQFAAYDAIISKINQQSSFVTQLITAANKSTN